MISISITQDCRYRVEYRLEGVLCVASEYGELASAMIEIEQKMRMLMGITKGKTFTSYTRREI